MPDEQQQPQQHSLYRRHRPRTFDEVVGQESVVRTLRNAVERGKVHHAYLFVGSRGTGKTSMAKILAACLNCEQGPTVSPCGQCESCRSIASANSIDVIEMDAASNNSVDDIRELRESVAYAPLSGRSKVYILDEAHMLSTAAWNAFLKTLEEPPADTVFVLATTEAQKVPATVIDRCHRFDFHRPTVEQVASVVNRAAQAEQIEIPPAAVAAVARSATGSFRDALGTLEQLVTYSGQVIALEDVLAVLGVADSKLLEETFDAVGEGNAKGALLAIGKCSESGRDASAFTSDLEGRARELLLVQTLGEVPDELSLTPEADELLSAQAERIAGRTIVRMLELLGAAREAIKAGSDPRTQLELALVKSARPEVDASTKALLARIERLEQSGAGIAVAAAPEASLPASSAVPQPEASEPPLPAAASTSEPVAEPSPETVSEPVVEPEPTVAPAAEDLSAAPTAPPAPTAPGDSGTALPSDLGAAPSPGPATPGAPMAPPGAHPLQADSEIEMLSSLWPAVVDLVRSENALLGACIAEALPIAVAGKELTVAFPFSASFNKKKAEDPLNRSAVSEALHAVTAKRLLLVYELSDELPGVQEAEAAAADRTDDEWVDHFMSEFDAEELHSEEQTEPRRAQEGE